MTIKYTNTNKQTQETGLSILVYGQSGAGKTRLTATIKEPVVMISSEQKSLSLSDCNIPVMSVESADDVFEAINLLKTSEFDDIKWVVVDSISDIAESIFRDINKKTKDGRKAYGDTAILVTDVLMALKLLPKHKYVIAKLSDKEGFREPLLPGQQLGRSLPYVFDSVFFYHVGDKNAEGNVPKFLQTFSDSRTVAKNSNLSLENYEEPDLNLIKQKLLGENS